MSQSLIDYELGTLRALDALKNRDLEEAAEQCAEQLDKEAEYQEEWINQAYLVDAFKCGAKWQKEQMMGKAIRGRVCINVESNYHSLIYGCWDMDNALKNCNDGDKVKVIIVKDE